MSASSYPRKSLSRNPDEMLIIGTVGTYWNDSGSAKHSDSVSSYKGIPNTTSKYREDKRVNWYSTRVEARLEKPNIPQLYRGKMN
ncbi:protein JASON-like [Olea europaea var. sylvestris]|uniref:protein JASON-like n=1 Tax=Olea europaea var. sylvestris TaxID=158386 RepID=UPI000C1D469C|nr:protein JASON-like [Olea europaea var. sylvestris]